VSEEEAEDPPGALQIWLDASRPKTLSAAVAPVLVGAAMAFEAGSFDWLASMLCLAAALSVQVGTNFINDYCDFQKGADTAARHGPQRACAAGLVAPATMLRASLMAFSVTLAAGGGLAWLAGWEFMAIAVLGVFCGAAYTAGPFPLGYNGLGDLFAFLFFGPVAVAATWYSQVGTLPVDVWVASLAPGCYSIALISVNNLRDADEDSGTGKRTLAVLFGKNFARIEYVIATLIACAAPIVLVIRTERHVFAALAAVMIIPGLAAMKLVFKAQGRQLNRVLAATGAMMLMHAVVFSIGWVIG
jgi:1,4-dihydroxy-2-naphthoate octaprenyltransferase